LRNEDAFIQGVIERVQERTGGSCTVIRSPIAGIAARTAQQQGYTAALCPVRIACTEVQQLVRACNSVVFLSPTVVAPEFKRRCVVGSFLAFFLSAEGFIQNETFCCFRMRMLDTATPI
jgi:hypothetical protein